MASEELILVFLTNRVKELIKEVDLNIDKLSDALENMDELRLFYYKSPKNIEDGESGIIALPFEDGKYVLFLKQNDEEEEYFVAIEFWDKTKNPVFTDSPDHLVMDNILCKFFKYNDDTSYYLDDSIDHQQLQSKVHELKPWEPNKSNPEAKKWSAYFKLHDELIKIRQEPFALEDINITGNRLSGRIRNAAEVDIDTTSCRNRDVLFSAVQYGSTEDAKKLGKLKSISRNMDDVRIDLDENFHEEYIKLLSSYSTGFSMENGKRIKFQVLPEDKFYEKKKSLRMNSGRLTFYLERSPYFHADILFLKSDRNEATDNGHNKRAGAECCIDQSSIQPLRLECSIDYTSEKYQLDVMKRCFQEVQKKPIWKILSGDRVTKLPQKASIPVGDSRLDEDQLKAVEGALGAQELFLIWGPPGTGKTEVIKEIAIQECRAGNKTLIASQSNLAVDNALARLCDEDTAYPFRIAKKDYELDGEDRQKVPFQESIPQFYLESLKNRVSALVSEEYKDIQESYVKAIEARLKDRPRKKDKEEISDVEEREITQFAELYKKKINVVGATLMVCGREKNRANSIFRCTGIDEFDTVIVDEVSKATPPELYIPIPLAEKRLILVGDFKQLPPIFNMPSGDQLSLEEAANEAGVDLKKLDYEDTIFERLWVRHAGDASSARAMLTKQYRMHPEIQGIIEPFYTDTESGDKLKCGLNNDKIESLNIDHDFFSNRHAMWIGTQGLSGEKKDGTSFYNEDEIVKVGKLLDKLAKIDDKDLSVGVITFYGAQLRRLRNEYDTNTYKRRFGEGKLIFGTVDRFQGRECDVIICSLVRNNKHGNIGFAKKPNRINVAFSRARRSLIILGSRETFAYKARDEGARKIYKDIYNKCEKPKPKELKP